MRRQYDLQDYIDDLKSGIESWVRQHDWDFFKRLNEDSIIENLWDNAYWEHIASCPDGFDCSHDVSFPDVDIESELRAQYADLCAMFGIDDIMADMKDIYDSLDDFRLCPFEIMAVFVRGIHLNHAHGSITDYCTLLTPQIVNSISQNGLCGTFGQEMIDNFVETY